MCRPLALVLCALLALPLPAAAEEVQAVDAAAAEIGRDLMSPDASVRSKAQDRLLARMRQGGDHTAFLKAMGDAIAQWANRTDRLLEVWLFQAVHGNAEERAQAVKLLAALGAPAIRRLSLELRHRIQHEGGAAPATPPPPPDAAAADEPQEANDAEPQAPRVRVLPQIYKLGDLLDRGLSTLELRGLLQKAADAVEVKQLGSTYIVTASQKGHDALFARLEELRKGAKQLDQLRDPSKAKPDPKPQEAAPSKNDEAPPAAPPKPAPPPKGNPGQDGPLALTDRWRVEPVLVHLPEQAWARAYGLDPKARSVPAGLPTVDAAGGIGVHVGTIRQSVVWARAVRRIPDARSEELSPVEGLPINAAADFFAGKQIRYTGDIRRTKGGAWGLVTKTIRHGIGLKVDVMQAGSMLHIKVAATRTDVGLPIPVVRVKPSENAAPVELERPEWSTTRAHAAFDLQPAGGGAFLVLDGLAGERERVVLVLTVTPARPDTAASATKKAAR